MVDVLHAVLKWLSQALILASSVWALFHDLYQSGPATSRRRLTRAGWIHVAMLATGFIVFGVTELQEMRKTALQKRAAEEQNRKSQERDRLQRQQIAHQEQLLDKQQAIETAQKQVIAAQDVQNERLRQMMLESYQLSGVEIALEGIEKSFAGVGPMLNRVRDDMRSGGMPLPEQFRNHWQYFETCLANGRLSAVKCERDQWMVECLLARPQGFTNPPLYCAPESYPWRAFEGLLDLILTRRFVVESVGGDELFAFTQSARPATVRREGMTVFLTLAGPRVKVRQLQNTPLRFRLEHANPQVLPRRARLRSLDPLVKFDESYPLSWRQVKIGTVRQPLEPGDEPQEWEVTAPVAGPFRMRVLVDQRFWRDASAVPASPPPGSGSARAR